MWTYSGDPSTSLADELRFTIGDTDPEYPLLQNEEIAYALELHENNLLDTAIYCCQSILAKWVKETTYKTETETVNLTDRINSMKSLISALELRRRKMQTRFPHIPYTEPTFKIGMNDNAPHNKG